MKTLAPGIQVTDGALTQIVVRAAEGVEGARVRRNAAPTAAGTDERDPSYPLRSRPRELLGDGAAK